MDAIMPTSPHTTNPIDAKLVGLFDTWKEALADALRASQPDKAYDRVADLERKIFATPAHTVLGVQIKLSLWRLYVDNPDDTAISDYREAAALSAYSDLVRMTGRDMDAEMRAFRDAVINARDAA
jgi:hypothetical protein